jgi:hypothetical protein
MIVVHFDFQEDKFHIRHVDESRGLAVDNLIKKFAKLSKDSGF